MGYDSNTKTLSRPLNTENIRACLGENSLSVKNLACSPLINPKSKYKPMRFTDKNGNAYYPALTEADMLSINYGIVIKAYTFESGDFDSIVGTMGTEIERSLDLTNTSKDEKAFYYDRLVETNEKDIGRMTDFFGYQHLAGDWFTPSFELKGVVGQANSCRLRLNWGNILTGFGDLKNWDAYKDLFEETTPNMTACFGFIMKPKGRAWNAFTHFYCILTQEEINQLDGNLIEFTPESGSAGEWDIYPVLVGGSFGASITIASSRRLYELADISLAGTIVPMPYATPEVWKIAQAGGDNESGGDIVLFNLMDYLSVDISANATILDVGVARINGVTANITVTKNAETTKVPTFTVSSMTVSSDMQGATELVGTMTHFNEPTNVTEGNGIVVSIMAKEGEEENATRVTYESVIYLTINYSDSFNKSYIKTYELEIGK